MITKPKKRKTPYWWGVRERAEKRGFFTGKEIGDALDWATCACGKQGNLIEWEDGFPKDRRIGVLGSRFGKHVSNHRFKLVENTLLKIEAAIVIAQSIKDKAK